MKKLLLNFLVIGFALGLSFCTNPESNTAEETQDSTSAQNETDSVDTQEELESEELKEKTPKGEVLNVEEVKETDVLKPGDLFVSVAENAEAWEGKIVTVAGIVSSRTVVTSNGEKSLQLTVSKDKDSEGGAFCIIPLEEGEEPDTKIGDEVTVLGKINGMFFEKSVRLKEAKFVE